jgi:hypothetical protein
LLYNCIVTMSGTIHKQISNICCEIFPNLDDHELQITITCVNNIISAMLNKLFTEMNNFDAEQLIIDDINVNVKYILTSLLPYFDIDYANTRNIYKLNDIITKKKKDVDINKESPEYIYNSMQYSIYTCKDKRAYETPFDINWLNNNKDLIIKTINDIGNSLYPNFHNIIQYSTDNVLYSNLSKHTTNKLMNKTYDDNNGLSFHMIYGTIVNLLYAESTDIKWSFYDIYYKKYNNVIPLIVILNDTLHLSKCINNIPWTDLNNDEQYNFKNSLNNLISHCNYEPFNKIVTILLIYFDLYSPVELIQTAINNGYSRTLHIKQIQITDRDPSAMYLHHIDQYHHEIYFDIHNQYNEFKDNISDIIQIFYTIQPIYMYEFMRMILFVFSKNFFGKTLITRDTIVNQMELITCNKYISIVTNNHYNGIFKCSLQTINYIKEQYNSHITIFGNNFFITPYILYEYVRHLSVFQNKTKNILLPVIWDSLPSDYKTILRDRIHIDMNNKFKWSNLKRHISNIYINAIDIKSHAINWLVNRTCMCIMPDQIIMALCYKGLLTYITNTPDQLSNILSNQSDSHIYSNMTCELYANMIVEYNSKQMSYLEYLHKTNNSHNRSIALNYISQLIFYFKNRYNLKMLLTGDTGVGKTTNFPRLLSHSEYILFFKYNSFIVCTEPKQTLTTIASNNISLLIGTTVNKKEYYVQYQYQGASHIPHDELGIEKEQYANVNRIYFCTDGIFKEIIYSNPILKQKNKEYLSIRNVIDVVIIDEIHERNTNIDIILMYIRYAMYYNTSIRLRFITATVSELENVVRRYFNMLCDNCMYPINMYNSENKYTSHCIDMRYNLSTYTTKKYNVNITFDNRIRDHFNPMNMNVDVLIDFMSGIILANRSVGDIIVFLPTIKLIETCVIELNQKLHVNTICVPYHSKINSQINRISASDKPYSDILSEYISTGNISLFNFNKKDTLSISKNGLRLNNIDHYAKYDNVVIFTTSVAESSLTIVTARVVIDTGITTLVYYDSNSSTDVVHYKYITPTSFKQRMGRVGRVSDGYYIGLFNYDDIINSKIIHNISTDDLSENLLKLIASSHKSGVLITSNNDHNAIVDVTQLKKARLDIAKIIFKQCFTIDKKKIMCNVHANTQCNENTYSIFNSRKVDGYDIDMIYDVYGIMFPEHVSEHLITRNIKGNIISVNDIDIKYGDDVKLVDGMVYSKKIYTFIYSLICSRFFVILPNMFFKCKYTMSLSKICTTFQKHNIYYSIDIILLLLYAHKYDVVEEFTIIVSFLQIYSKTRNINIFNARANHQQYSNENGDFEAFINIFNNIKKITGYTNNTNTFDYVNVSAQMNMSYISLYTLITSYILISNILNRSHMKYKINSILPYLNVHYKCNLSNVPKIERLILLSAYSKPLNIAILINNNKYAMATDYTKQSYINPFSFINVKPMCIIYYSKNEDINKLYIINSINVRILCYICPYIFNNTNKIDHNAPEQVHAFNNYLIMSFDQNIMNNDINQTINNVDSNSRKEILTNSVYTNIPIVINDIKYQISSYKN